MKIEVKIKYYKGYIPYRCRKTRYEEVGEVINTNIKEVTFEDLQLKYSWIFSEKIELFLYKNSLFRKATIRDICAGGFVQGRYETIIDALKWWHLNGSWYYSKCKTLCYSDDKSLYETKEDIIKKIKSDFKKYLLVDGELYVKDNKPLYHICTFGLGNNHGGTGWMITQSKYSAKALNKMYNQKCYFEADDYYDSYVEALNTALNRGDTLDTERFTSMYEKQSNKINIF